MTEKTCLQIHKIYGILLSVSLLIAGICLMAGCLCIYCSNEVTPYSREIVGETFGSVALPVCLFPVLAVLGLFLPGNAPAGKGKRSIPAGMILGKDLSALDAEAFFAVTREQKGRKNRSLILLGLAVLGSLLFLWFALSPANREGGDINGYMIRCMWVLLPCLAVPFVFGIYASVYNQKSLARQWELVKKCPALKVSEAYARKQEMGRRLLAGGLALIAVALIVLGRISGGAADVLTKAINICTECIGLG